MSTGAIAFSPGPDIFAPALTATMRVTSSPDRMPVGTRILIAEDDPVSRQILEIRLKKLGYVPVVTCDGQEAIAIMRSANAPTLAIIDWMMPGMDGIEVCRRAREAERGIYIILLTALGSKENIVEGLHAGADDYLVKPFHAEELQARILVGLRVMKLQETLADRVKALEAAGAEINSLKLLLPL